MPAESTEVSADWRAVQLAELDRGAPGRFVLRVGRSPADYWLLVHGGRPVGVIQRGAAVSGVRTASEEWRMRVSRRKPIGWQLSFTPRGGGEPLVRYVPRSLRQGGTVHVAGHEPYALRGPLLRAAWRLFAPTGDEIARIAFQIKRPVETGFRPAELRRGNLSTGAVDSALLPIVLVAAAAGIVVHYSEVLRLPGGHV